jgi:hypothetical protein
MRAKIFLIFALLVAIASYEPLNKTSDPSVGRVQSWRNVEPSLDKKLNDLIIVVSLNKGIVDKISLSQSEFKLNSDSELLFIKLNNPLMFVNLSKGCYRYSPDKVTPIECSPETMEPMNVGEMVRYLVKKHNEVLGLKVKAIVQELIEAYLTIKTKSSPVR